MFSATPKRATGFYDLKAGLKLKATLNPDRHHVAHAPAYVRFTADALGC